MQKGAPGAPVCAWKGLWAWECWCENKPSVPNDVPRSCVHPEPPTVTLFGNKVFADVTGFVKMRAFWIRVGPKPSDRCPYKKRRDT